MVQPIQVTRSTYCKIVFLCISESLVVSVLRILLICKSLNFTTVFTKKNKLFKVCIQFSVWKSWFQSNKSNSYCHSEAPVQRCSWEWCSKNIQQIYRRLPIPMFDFEIALWHGWSPVNLVHIFRAPFPKNTCGRLLLYHS